MSAQMVSSSSNPGAADDMKLLEEQAKKVAETAHEDQPKKKAMTFVKYTHLHCVQGWLGVLGVMMLLLKWRS